MGFSKDFLWGASTAALQIEGAYDEDGKGLGIWDEEEIIRGHIKHNEDAKTAADHYHHYKEDVALMKEIGLKAYRFSISWPRVMPERGVINEKGLEFYDRLVDELKNAGIEPMVTLFHWNLPLWAHAYGGWTNPQIIEDYVRYVQTVVSRLSDRVQYWITFNEMQLFAGSGYVDGSHAPFIQNRDIAHQANLTRNIMLSHGEAVRWIRENAIKKPQIGMAPTGSAVTPFLPGPEGEEMAYQTTYTPRAGIGGFRWWMDPIILRELPEELKDYISEEDLDIIAQPLDFFGFNIYRSQNAADMPGGRVGPGYYPGLPRNSMGWSISPEVLYWLPKFHYRRYGLPLLITENGYAGHDFVFEDGRVHDPARSYYIRTYLRELKKAVDEGIPVIGYNYWSLMDNFEWTEGYDERFGLIYIDYANQTRTLKDSAYEYKKIIETSGENL